MTVAAAHGAPNGKPTREGLIVLVYAPPQTTGDWRGLVHALEDAGHSACVATSEAMVVDTLESKWIDSVIVHTLSSEPPAVLRWLRSHRPRIPCIVAVEPSHHSLYSTQLRQHNEVEVWPNSYEASTLSQHLIDLGPKLGFVASQVELELFDYVQITAQNSTDRLIEVTTPRGVGRMWIRHGSIVHCTYHHLVGDAAFFAIFSAQRGAFRETFYTDPPEESVQGSSTHLLMEAARLQDEGALSSHESELEDYEQRDPGSWATWSEATATQSQEAASSRRERNHLRLVEDGTQSRREAIESTQDTYSSSSPGQIASVEHQSTVDDSLDSMLEDPEVRSMLVEQFFAEEGVQGVAIFRKASDVVVDEMRGVPGGAQQIDTLLRGAQRLMRILNEPYCNSAVVHRPNTTHLLLTPMGASWVALAVDGKIDADELRDRVLGLGQ